VTATATDACNNTTTCTFTVTVLPNPSCNLIAPNPRPNCGSIGNTLCANASNAVAYQWSILSGAGWVITSRTDSNCIVYTAGSADSVTIKLVVTNAVGCKDSCSVTYGCISPYWGCTLGFWKNHTQIWDEPSDPISLCLANALSALGSPYSGN